LDGPERELLSFLEIGIFQVNKIQAAFVTRTDVWLVFAKYQSIKGAPISWNLNPYDNVILVALPLDSQNLCGDGRQWCFLGLKFPDYVRSARVFGDRMNLPPQPGGTPTIFPSNCTKASPADLKTTFSFPVAKGRPVRQCSAILFSYSCRCFRV